MQPICHRLFDKLDIHEGERTMFRVLWAKAYLQTTLEFADAGPNGPADFLLIPSSLVTS